jgi:hypothetical protein
MLVRRISWSLKICAAFGGKDEVKPVATTTGLVDKGITVQANGGPGERIAGLLCNFRLSVRTAASPIVLVWSLDLGTTQGLKQSSSSSKKKPGEFMDV